jgi:hypothetical protein
MEGYRPAKNSLSNLELWRYSHEAYYATLNPILYGQDPELWFEGVMVARIYKHSFARLRTQIRAKGCRFARFMSSLWCWTEGRRRNKVMSQVGRSGLLTRWQTRIDWSNVSEAGTEKIVGKCRLFHFIFGYLHIQQSATNFMQRFPVWTINKLPCLS